MRAARAMQITRDLRQEELRALVLRLAEERFKRGLFEDLALISEDHTVSHLAGIGRAGSSIPMDIAVLGIGLGKAVCGLAGVDGENLVVLRRRIQRFRLLEFLALLPPCIVAMKTCGGAQNVGWFCLQFGYEPRLMSPPYVQPYMKVH